MGQASDDEYGENVTASGKPAGLRRFVPISFWLASYEKGDLAFDLIAALTVWALIVPESMAYASLAGMPPEYGLYAALVAPLAYAIFGTSRQLNVGPSSTVAVVSFSVGSSSKLRSNAIVTSVPMTSLPWIAAENNTRGLCCWAVAWSDSSRA